MKEFKIYRIDEIVPFRDVEVLRMLQEKYDLVEITDLEEFYKMPKSSPILRFGIREYFKSCLKKGGMIYLVFDRGTLIFRACVQRGPHVALLSRKVGLFFNDDACYVELCETHPSYRGQRVYPYALHEVQRRVIPLSYELYIATEASNVASENGILYAGFKLFNDVRNMNKGYDDDFIIRGINIGYFISYNFKKYIKIMRNIFI